MKPTTAWALVLMLATGCGEDSSGEGTATPAPPTPTDAVSPAETEVAVNPFDSEQLRLSLAGSAKRLCSAMFLAGRTREHVLAEELEEIASQKVSFEIGDSPRLVVASAAGEKATALFRPHLGCTLVDPRRVTELANQIDAAALPAAAVPGPDAAWPLGARVELPDQVPGLDLRAVAAAVDQAFADRDPAAPVRTRAVVVVHDGRIVAERYAEPFDADTPQLGWSMTKTVTGALTGILVKDGLLDVEAPAPVSEWQSAGDPRGAITLGHLLRMSSGLEFSEIYTVGSSSDVVLMLYGEGHRDMGSFTARKPLAHDPGTHWSYSSGTTNLIARIHRQAFDRLETYLAFPRERLFDPLGMASAVLEPDVSGTFVGSSYMWATPRDWARLGLLYLQDGVWNGERILPEGWVDNSLTPAPAAPEGQYGAQIWLNRGPPDAERARPRPELPPETYYFSGFEGQNVVVVPSRALVVVRMGLTRSGESPVWQLTRRILDAME